MSKEEFEELVRQINDILTESTIGKIAIHLEDVEDSVSALNIIGLDLIDDNTKLEFTKSLLSLQATDHFKFKRKITMEIDLLRNEREGLKNSIQSNSYDVFKYNKTKQRIERLLRIEHPIDDTIKSIEIFLKNFYNTISKNAVDRIAKLNREYETISIPNLYLSNWFSEFKSEIDLMFELKKIKPMESFTRIELITNHNEIINKIEEFENFLKKKRTQFFFDLNQVDFSTRFSLEDYECGKIFKLVSSFNELTEQINSRFEPLKKEIFRNQTILFLKNDLLVNNKAIDLFEQMNAETSCGRLILIDDFYIQPRKIANYFNQSSIKVLTNEMINLINIKNQIVSSKQNQTTILSLKKNEKYMDLSGNSIQTIEKTAFDGFSYLTDLFLNDNSISKIDSDIFAQITNLEWLSLKNNCIKSINPLAFESLKKLIGLNLAGNELSVIEPNTFKGLSCLKLLNLKENKIESILSNQFSGLVSLEVLNLSSNMIVNLSEDLFNPLNELKELYLNGNKLKNLHANTFNSLIKLRILDISFNFIENIQPDLFRFLTNLIQLDLNSNKICSIESGSFDGLSCLKILNLDNNFLKDIKFKLFSQLSRLAALKIDPKAYDIDYVFNRLLSSKTLQF